MPPSFTTPPLPSLLHKHVEFRLRQNLRPNLFLNKTTSTPPPGTLSPRAAAPNVLP